MDLNQEFYLPNYIPFTDGNYLVDEASTASSPSPIMFNGHPRQGSLPLIPEQPVPQIEQYSYSLPQEIPGAFHQYPADPYQAHHTPIVEFTDLTLAQDDRRRRRSQVKDKAAISSMHMVRRTHLGSPLPISR